MRDWLLLIYKVPNEPSASRVYVWRKLKRLGAVLLHDAAWILPATEYTREQYQWLASEIEEMKGEATVWESRLELREQEEGLVRQFMAQVDATYKEIAAELSKSDADLAALSRQYQQVKSQDYFQSPLGQRVHKVLRAAREKSS